MMHGQPSIKIDCFPLET